VRDVWEELVQWSATTSTSSKIPDRTHRVLVQLLLLSLVVRFPLLFLLLFLVLRLRLRRFWRGVFDISFFLLRRYDVVNDTLQHVLVRRLLWGWWRLRCRLSRSCPSRLTVCGVVVSLPVIQSLEPASRESSSRAKERRWSRWVIVVATLR
jgi:hypothetical protein